jgi:N-methylhydantoinase B
MIEADLPIAIERYALVPDTGGPGKYRGGLALERHLRFKANRATLQIRSDRRDHPPYGLQGGKPGAPSMVGVRRQDGREEAFPSKFLTTVDKGDLFYVRLAGAGGWGEPIDRDPSAVLSDVLEEKISIQHARDAYGVVVAGVPPTVDHAETAQLRSQFRNR